MRTHRDIWVYVETENGKAKNVGYELINVARPIAEQLGCKLMAVLVGNGVMDAAKDAIGYGADGAYVIEGQEYDYFNTDAFTGALVKLVKKYEPETLMLGATLNGRDVAPRIACRLGTGLTADCTEIGIDPDTSCVAWTRPTFGGNLMATIICPEQRPQMGTVRPGVFQKAEFDASRTGEIIVEDIHVNENMIRTEVIEHVEEIVESINLEDAEVVVCGGRGVGSAENFKILEELAEATGGMVACTRAVVESGWMEHSRQVGQSGKTVAPTVYFAVGLSGAVQHVAGIKGSKAIVAINKDPEASIFDIADYSIVGDLNEIVPAITAAIKAKKN